MLLYIILTAVVSAVFVVGFGVIAVRVVVGVVVDVVVGIDIIGVCVDSEGEKTNKTEY